jgi:hypothetical protein
MPIRETYYQVTVIENDGIAHDTYQVLSPDGIVVYSSDAWHSHETVYELAALLNYESIQRELGTNHPFLQFYRRMIWGYAFNFSESSDIRYAVSDDIQRAAREVAKGLSS